MTTRIGTLTLCLALIPATAAAVPNPPVSLTEGRTTAMSALDKVQKQTPGSLSHRVTRCAHPDNHAYLVDCKGYVRRSNRSLCRLTVRVSHNADGLVYKFVGRSSCTAQKRSLSGSPGTVI